MRIESAYLRRFRNPYRNAYEMWCVFLWIGALLYVFFLWKMGVMPWTYIAIMAAISAGMIGVRFAEASVVLRRRGLLSGYRVSFMSFQDMKRMTRPNELWLGLGFVWTPEHTQKVYELSKIDVRKWMLSPGVLGLLGRADEAQPETEAGCPWLHGLSDTEIDFYKYLKNFEGGTLLLGTTQAGKGVMLGVLISQAIFQGRCVIVIDPKSSPRMLKNIQTACRLAGRDEPFYFHPAFPKESCRLDPLFNWNNPGEIASRIVSVMPADSDGAFKSFAWSAVNTVACALIELEIQPTIRLLAHHIDTGIEPLLYELLQTHVKNVEMRSDWKDLAIGTLPPNMPKNITPMQAELMVLVAWYENIMEKAHQTRVIESALKVYRHSRDHYSKITASLMPIFAMLTSGTLEKMLSPDPNDIDDTREILDANAIIEKNRVIYIGLDSLPNPTVANTLGALMLAELASIAGARYNLRKNDRQIALFVDEASNVINQPLIEILNKGAEGGFQSTLAMQTIADLSHRLGSQDAARMVLGNLNNLIAMRSKDRPTQEFITETFGKTYVSQVDTTLASHASVAASAPAFDAGASHRRSSSRDEVIPCEYLGRLPNCQFFANVAGGTLFKGRVPILFDEENP